MSSGAGFLPSTVSFRMKRDPIQVTYTFTLVIPRHHMACILHGYAQPVSRALKKENSISEEVAWCYGNDPQTNLIYLSKNGHVSLKPSSLCTNQR